jgi:hypothetical protein
VYLIIVDVCIVLTLLKTSQFASVDKWKCNVSFFSAESQLTAPLEPVGTFLGESQRGLSLNLNQTFFVQEKTLD